MVMVKKRVPPPDPPPAARAATAPAAPAAAPPTSAQLQTLVRRLVSEAGGTPTPPSNRVLIDTQIDGVRCLLVREPPATPPLALSPREREIARMIARGLPNKSIAAALEISVWTVGTYLRRIFSKLGVSSRAAMVARLMEGGAMDAEAGAAPARAGAGR
jgi:DNA-binding CsgD family transcriptional regulator